MERLFKRRLIESAPKKLFEFRGALGDLAGKTDLAYSLGWISENTRSDLHQFRRIRNAFAHDADHNLSFDSDSMRDRTRSLSAPKQIFELQRNLMSGDLGESWVIEQLDKAGARRRFELGFAFISMLLASTLAKSERPEEAEDKWNAQAVEFTLKDGQTATIDQATMDVTIKD